VINDILDFSKIEAAKIDLESTDFNLRDALESMLKTVALRADNKGLELLCEVAEEVPAVICGDATRLRQVVINLVGNATKFTEHSEVSVRVETETRELNECMLRFTVMDSGIGTPEEKQELIFAAFSQGGYVDDQKVWRHATGIDDFQEAGGDDGRADLGGKRIGARKPVSRHGAAPERWKSGERRG